MFRYFDEKIQKQAGLLTTDVCPIHLSVEATRILGKSDVFT